MTKYNGWSNYETWNCKLWLDNEPTPYEMISEHIHFLRNCGKNYKKNDIVYKTSQFIKDQLVEPYQPKLEPSMFSDMLSASLREINYYEIATAYYDDLWQWVDDEKEKVDFLHGVN